MPAPTRWFDEVAALYQSGAASQFILHGNVNDLFLVEGKESSRLGSLMEELLTELLTSFDVVLRYDLGSGLRAEKGAKVFQEWPSAAAVPSMPSPREAVAYLSHYFRFCANLRQAQGKTIQVACIIKDAHLVAPAGPAGMGQDVSALALQMRDWAMDAQLSNYTLATFLVSENLNDLHPLLASNPRAAQMKVPLPEASDLKDVLAALVGSCSEAFKGRENDLEPLAEAFVGASLSAVNHLLKLRHYQKQPIADKDLAGLKKSMVERDAQGLIEFVPPERTLDDVAGMDAAKTWIRQDIALWKKGATDAMPMGYLLCGPVGTGKTFMAECLAGEAGVPVVKLANFRDRWVGSTESNLERIFRLLHALGRCVVFVDEADQALGKRDSGASDGGLSGRVYAMIAKEMSNSRMRGRILWLLASSRPDLIEVDLKRPGRVDVKIPLFPAADVHEAWVLLRALCKRRGLNFPETPLPIFEAHCPRYLTAGAAEALSVKITRQVKGRDLTPEAALEGCLLEYQAPVSEDIMRFQIALAAAEATEKTFVPESFRSGSGITG
jgi:hypothetical protein